MPLSDFGYDILRVLDEADSSISLQEIAEVLSEKQGTRIVAGRVRPYLEHALGEYVDQKSPDRWGIASPHHGKFAVSKRPAKGRESPKRKTSKDNEEGESEYDELSKMVVKVLSDAERPLRASRIAEIVAEASNGISGRASTVRTKVNRRLYRELSALVEKDDNHHWGLVEKEYVEEEDPDEVESAGPDVDKSEKSAGDGHSEKDGDKDSEKEDRNDIQENSETNGEDGSGESEDQHSGSPTPSGVAGEIGAKLETAKQIVFLLDLARQPVSVSALTAVITARGRDVSAEMVRRCLESMLSRFVGRAEEGYRLKENYDRPGAGPDHAAPPDKLRKSEEDDEPVDATTRATVSGAQYEYIFEEAEFADTALLFSRQIRGGTVKIELNSAHSAFGSLKHVLDSLEDSNKESVQGRLREAIRLLIVAWTEVEGNLSGRRSDLAEEMRVDWGRALRRLLRERA